MEQKARPISGKAIAVKIGVGEREAVVDADEGLRVFSTTFAQSIQAYGHLLTGMSWQLLGASIHFNSRNDSRVDEDSDKGDTAFCLLMDRFVVEHRRRCPHRTMGGNYRFAAGSPSFYDLWNTRLCKSFIAGGGALVHRTQVLIVCDKGLCGISQHLRIHLRILVFCSYSRCLSLSAKEHFNSKGY